MFNFIYFVGIRLTTFAQLEFEVFFLCFAIIKYDHIGTLCVIDLGGVLLY